MHEKSPDITNKSIVWGDTSDFIANVETFFVCCGKFLEDTIQNNLKISEVFLANISGGAFSSSNFVFVVYGNFAHDSETYDSMKFN